MSDGGVLETDGGDRTTGDGGVLETEPDAPLEETTHDDYAPPEVVTIDEGAGPVEATTEMIVALTVEGAVTASCSTSIVSGLSQQLVSELQCMRPGTFESIAGIDNVSLGSAASEWMQTSAARALRRAAARRSSATMFINSSLRSLPQQYLLYRWQRVRCGIEIAAAPGLSNHNGALAIDIESNAAWRSSLQAEGFAWLGSGDPVHFDYVGGGTTDIRSLSVLAFQRLWNRNNPSDRIAEDGDFGASTESRLRQSPAVGFAIGACGSPPPPPPPPATTPIGATWERLADGSYLLTARSASSVATARFLVDGFSLGDAPRGTTGTYELRYRFSDEREGRAFEVRALNAAGAQVGRATGSLDSVPGTGVFVRPTDAGSWEIGLERAPSGVANIEVRADGYLLTDSVSRSTRSARRIVTSNFSTLGERNIEIRTYGEDGILRGTLRRTVTLAR
jgi:hypothetical protein